jgi:excisionase family DNA binding protein
MHERPKKMITPRELAETLNVSLMTIQRMRERGEIPYILVSEGNYRSIYRYDLDEVMAALEDNTDAKS